MILVRDPRCVEHSPGALRVTELLDGVDVVEDPGVAPCVAMTKSLNSGWMRMSRTETAGKLIRKSCQCAPSSRDIQRPFSVPA